MCELQKSNMNVRSWALDFKEEMCNIGLAFMLTEQQECNLREITNIVKDRYNDTEGGKNILQNCQR